MKKNLVITLISFSLLMSACTKSFAGHSITVNVPTNGCGVSTCTTAPAQPDILIVK